MKRQALVEVAACAVATLGTGLLYRQFFATNEYLVPLCIASLGGALVAALAAARRWSFGRTLLATGLGFLLLAAYGVFGDTVEYGVPTRDTATEIFWGVVGGWARMFTVGLPADVRGDLLITPVLVTWVAAVLGATLATRTSSVLAPVAPPLAAFAIALLFVGDRPGIQVTATATFLAGVLVLLLLRANRMDAASSVDQSGQQRRVSASGLLFGVPVIVVVAVLGVLGGQILPFAPGEDRFDPRELHPPPVLIADTLTPLAKLKSQLREQPPRQLFTVDFGQATRPVDRIRIAALDQYDGTLWTSADEFVIAGRRLAADQTLTRTTPVSARIEIDSLAGPFLPELGRPSRLELAGNDTTEIGFSESSGVLATTEPSPRGLRYATVGEVSARDDGLALALPSATTEFLRYTDLPASLPPQLRVLARQLTSTDPTPYGKLVAIERYLRALPYSLDADPGHSYGALTKLLTGTNPNDDAAYAEQHAAAFAVLARAAGFPARVAIGYRLPNSPNGFHSVSTSDAHAWAEVTFDGYGWVTFEPTDTTRTSNDHRTRPDSPVAGQQQANPPLAAPPVVGPLPDPQGDAGSGWGGVLRTTALAAISLVSLFAIAAAVTVVEKARRRWRRRRATSRSARVLGAWQEMIDRLVERGATIAISATASEAAESIRRGFGTAAEPMVSSAPLATAAVFAPDKLTDHDVVRAWDLEAQLRRGLSARSLSPRRLWAWFDPRPLLTGWRDARQSRKSLRRLGVE